MWESGHEMGGWNLAGRGGIQPSVHTTSKEGAKRCDHAQNHRRKTVTKGLSNPGKVKKGGKKGR